MVPRCALGFVVTLILLFFTARPLRAGVAQPLLEGTLANGLRVVIAPNPANADVSIVVTYNAGARDEPGGKEGLAHLVEHLMFFGSRHVAPGAHMRLLEQAGATSMNGVTSPDTTTYFETVPPERLELALWLESDRMAYGLERIDGATLERARREVQNERRDRVVDAPIGELPAIMRASLFPSWHPYHHVPIGLPEAIAGASLADARAFADTWYGPANAVLVIAGRVDPGAAAALVTRYFASLPARPPPERTPLPFLSTTQTTIVHVQASVTREEVRLAWATPRFGARGDKELDLAAALLVDHGAGWLERATSQSPRICSQVRAFQDSMAFTSLFEVHAVVAPGRSLKEALYAIIGALGHFEGGTSDDEIQRARVLLQRSRLYGMESSLGLARQLASYARLGHLPRVYDGLSSQYAAITPQAVRDTVRTWIGRKPWVAALVYPTRSQPTAGVVSGRTELPW
jgi:predicted Zn-dependent peptidase